MSTDFIRNTYRLPLPLSSANSTYGREQKLSKILVGKPEELTW
jgi:hypothetical protein